MGRMRPAFTKRQLYAMPCIGPLAQIRKEPGNEAVGRGTPLLRSWEWPLKARVLRRAGSHCGQMALASAAPADPALPAPLGDGLPSDPLEGPTLIVRRNGSQGPNAKHLGLGQD
jgi:hypothetical protein